MDRRIATSCLALALLSGCGPDPYKAAEERLRGWLAALERDEFDTACDLLTNKYQREVAAQTTTGSCAAALDQMAGERGQLPPSDATMAVPAWDPSGEALIEVVDPSDGSVHEFWMQQEDDEWLVAGRESPRRPS